MNVDQNTARVRKYGLDFLKGIAACFVVFMHVRFPEPFGEYVARIGTFAVPVFFMTSGYFSLNASKSKTLKSIRRTAVYLFVAYLLNIIRIFAENSFDLGAVSAFFKTEVFTLNHMAKFIVLSQSSVSGVAWFLISLLVCYVLKYLLGRKLRYLGYLGLFIGVIGVLPPVSNYFGLPINNPWINGIPFFIIGELLADNKEWVKKNLSNVLLCVASIIGFGFSVALIIRTGNIQNNVKNALNQRWHIGTLLLSPSLFVLFSRMNMPFNRFCLFGSTYAFFIYIVHPLVMHAYDAIRTMPSISELWLRPIIVLAVTVLLAVIYYTGKSVVTKSYNKK